MLTCGKVIANQTQSISDSTITAFINSITVVYGAKAIRNKLKFAILEN